MVGTLPDFVRPAKSHRGFDWQFKMICSLIGLSGFANLKASSFCFGCSKLTRLHAMLTDREKSVVSLSTAFWSNACPHQCLQVCRRSLQALDCHSATGELMFLCRQ